jgi:DNA-binding GntR family transcriptional regulator
VQRNSRALTQSGVARTVHPNSKRKAPKLLLGARSPHGTTASELIRKIHDGLSEGRYVPGQKLVELDLMRQFNVGRSTVREALKWLASEGIVKLEPNRGAYIRDPSKEEVADILRVFEVLLGLSGRLAAENIGAPGAAARMGVSYEQIALLPEDQSFRDTVRRRSQWLQTVLEIGGSQQLARLMPAMGVHLVQLWLISKVDIDMRNRFYRTFSEAILAGDADRAERIGRRHVRDIRGRIAELPA